MNTRYERANLLKNAREEAGFTQKELSELLNYSDKTLSKWETGESYPTDYETLEKYAKLINLDISDIIIGKNKSTKEDFIISYIRLMRKYFLTLTLLIISIPIFLLISFYISYEKYEKGKIKVYRLSIDNKKSNNLLFKSNERDILSINKLDGDIDSIILYYKEKNDIVEIFHGSNDNYLINNDRRFNEYNLSNIENKKAYIKTIKKDNSVEDKEVLFEELYSNNYISTNKAITKRDDNYNCNSFVKHDFIVKDGTCYKKMNNSEIMYNPYINVYYINKYNIDELETIVYYPNRNYYILDKTKIDGTSYTQRIDIDNLLNNNEIRYLYYLEKEKLSS